MIKYILLTAGFILLIVFASPLYKSKINIGNVFGFLTSFELMAVGLLYKTPIMTRLLLPLLIANALVFVPFFVALARIVIKSRATATSQKTVIILGCRVKGDTPSKALRKRCEAACRHLIENPEAVAIASGGRGKDELMSEAECIRNVLIENGIEPERIYLEAKSTSTVENIRYSMDLIEKAGLDGKSIAISTSEYHICRALDICMDFGIEAAAISAKSIPVLRVPYFTREAIAEIYRVIKKVIG